MNQFNESQELATQSLESPRPALEWGTEVDRRPAPVVLAVVSGACLTIAILSPFKTFYGLALILALYSIQITIWRAMRLLGGGMGK